MQNLIGNFGNTNPPPLPLFLVTLAKLYKLTKKRKTKQLLALISTKKMHFLMSPKNQFQTTHKLISYTIVSMNTTIKHRDESIQKGAQTKNEADKVKTGFDQHTCI